MRTRLVQRTSRTKIPGEAVYRFQGGAYVLLKGEFLVPTL